MYTIPTSPTSLSAYYPDTTILPQATTQKLTKRKTGSFLETVNKPEPNAAIKSILHGKELWKNSGNHR
jgi:hypothetical protein